MCTYVRLSGINNLIRAVKPEEQEELRYDYLAPNDSAIGPPLDHAGDRVARDRRIFDVEAHGGALMVEAYLCINVVVTQAVRSQGMTVARHELTQPRESGSGA